MAFSGGCACGAIRYQCSTDPVAGVICYCRACQRASGGGATPGLVVAAASLTIEGEPRWHETVADSGNTVRRGFCAHCGSPLFSQGGLRAGFMAIKAGSLDDPSGFKPRVEVWTASAQPWHYLSPDLEKYQGNRVRSS